MLNQLEDYVRESCGIPRGTRLFKLAEKAEFRCESNDLEFAAKILSDEASCYQFSVIFDGCPSVDSLLWESDIFPSWKCSFSDFDHGLLEKNWPT